MIDWLQFDNLLTGFLHMQYRKWGWKLFGSDAQAKMGTTECAHWILILECLIGAILESAIVEMAKMAYSKEILLGMVPYL